MNPTKWLSGLSNARLYLIFAALSLSLIAGSFGAGYLVGGRNEARVQIKEVEKRIYVPVKEIQEVQVRNVEREKVLQQNLELADRNIANLQRRLDSRPVNTCPVDRTAVGVLNEAITGTPQADPTGVDADQGTTVTDLTNWSLTAIAQYNDLATRHNALVDWVDDELIKPQSRADR